MEVITHNWGFTGGWAHVLLMQNCTLFANLWSTKVRLRRISTPLLNKSHDLRVSFILVPHIVGRITHYFNFSLGACSDDEDDSSFQQLVLLKYCHMKRVIEELLIFQLERTFSSIHSARGGSFLTVPMTSHCQSSRKF